jgi:hypothetical protein
MDGVLTDWCKAAHQLNNLDYPGHHKWPYTFGPDGWDWNKQAGLETLNWDCMDRQFWANLEWMPDGREILEDCMSCFGMDSIFLFSSFYIWANGAVNGRLDWIEKNIPEFKKKFLTGTVPKSVCAHRDAVLIDDNDQNIHDFIEAGGQGILIPRPWNELFSWSDRVLKMLGNCLENFR